MADSIDIVYLNGEFLPLSEARVPVLDRGFIFGDGVYEFIPIYSRRAFRLDEHLQRLQRSLDAIQLANPLTLTQWSERIHKLVAQHTLDDQSIYLQVTRGPAKRTHEFPKDITPTVFMMSNALVTPSAEQIAHGVTCTSAVDFRWLRCDIKSISLLGNCLLKQAAVTAGAAEVVLFRDGFLTEAAASNVFAVRDGVLLAPPKDHLILPGITYDVVLELAAANNIPHQVRPVPEAEVRGAAELWLSSSSKEVLAVTTLDGRAVGTGAPGPLFRRMHALYQQFKLTVMRRAA
jgi:D-alanine transaminase